MGGANQLWVLPLLQLFTAADLDRQLRYQRSTNAAHH